MNLHFSNRVSLTRRTIVCLLVFFGLFFTACVEKEPLPEKIYLDTYYGYVNIDTTTNLCADTGEVENLAQVKVLSNPQLGQILNLDAASGCFDYQAGSVVGSDTFFLASLGKNGLADTTRMIVHVSKKPEVIPEYFSVYINDTFWTHPYPSAEMATNGSDFLILYAVNPFFANGFNIPLPSDVKEGSTYTIVDPNTDHFGVIYSWDASDAAWFTSGKITISRRTGKLIEGEFEGQIGANTKFTNGKFGMPIR